MSAEKFNIFDKVCGSWNILLVALVEVLIVGWLYGGNRIIDDILKMDIWMPKLLQYYWKLCWCFITPIIMTFILIMTFVGKKPLSYGKPLDDIQYPTGIQALAWLIPIAAVMLIPGFAALQIIIRYRRGETLGWSLFQPTQNWGPPESLLRKENVTK